MQHAIQQRPAPQCQSEYGHTSNSGLVQSAHSHASLAPPNHPFHATHKGLQNQIQSANHPPQNVRPHTRSVSVTFRAKPSSTHCAESIHSRQSFKSRPSQVIFRHANPHIQSSQRTGQQHDDLPPKLDFTHMTPSISHSSESSVAREYHGNVRDVNYAGGHDSQNHISSHAQTYHGHLQASNDEHAHHHAEADRQFHQQHVMNTGKAFNNQVHRQPLLPHANVHNQRVQHSKQHYFYHRQQVHQNNGLHSTPFRGSNHAASHVYPRTPPNSRVKDSGSARVSSSRQSICALNTYNELANAIKHRVQTPKEDFKTV